MCCAIMCATNTFHSHPVSFRSSLPLLFPTPSSVIHSFPLICPQLIMLSDRTEFEVRLDGSSVIVEVSLDGRCGRDSGEGELSPSSSSKNASANFAPFYAFSSARPAELPMKHLAPWSFLTVNWSPSAITSVDSRVEDFSAGPRVPRASPCRHRPAVRRLCPSLRVILRWPVVPAKVSYIMIRSEFESSAEREKTEQDKQFEKCMQRRLILQ